MVHKSRWSFDKVSLSDPDDENANDWDRFKDPPREVNVGSVVRSKFIENGVIVLKCVTIVFTLLIVLGCAVVSKGTLLFMTSQIAPSVQRPYCNIPIGPDLQFTVTLPLAERLSWIWFLIFAYFVPELGTFFRSIRICLFKTWRMPTSNAESKENNESSIITEFIFLFVTEIGPAIGSAIFIFIVLPELDVIKGAMLTNAVCFIPALVALFSRDPFKIHDTFKLALDIISVVAQASSFVIWPILEERRILYMIPIAVALISLGWWENFVSRDAKLPFIRAIAKRKQVFHNRTYFLYTFIAPLKCAAFLVTVCVIYQIRENDYTFLFNHFYEAFESHTILISEIEPIIPDGGSLVDGAVATGRGTAIVTNALTPFWVFLINIGTTYTTYAFSKFSCKIMVQEFGLAFPATITVPVLLSGLIAMCGMYTRDVCHFADVIPNYLFFTPPPLYFLSDFISHQHAYVWLIWLLSQAWITIHVWSPNCDKLSSTEKLFFKPMFDAFFIDQSLVMNRRREEVAEVVTGADNPRDYDESQVDQDRVTRIYACGTMWHEEKEEMLEFLKSVLRLDLDQAAHRIVRNVFKIELKNYYELETHIFFDDAFVRVSKKDNDPKVNSYVNDLISTVNKAIENIHGDYVIPAPTIVGTPYGGRLIWTLPGGTKFVAHLKDKGRIRAKKRWSQVMYMYYLLGHRLACNDSLSTAQKVVRSENTYILALDGDIDFQPEALHLLVDYMKKNANLGAACGRIHPIGSGAMVWYQIFEYAVGHWLQKATEHVIGCVLCSPGCFSLFRGKALMDNSVMKKYTTQPSEAMHYVQYDQGEDRWLCTLLLQRGYRVEYSAASDAYTHAPEGFNDFYKQRRRWMPSTMANIMDLLGDYQHTVKINDNISMIYIFYQIILMIGTVIGPGSIYLMLVGSFVAAFGLDQWSSFFWNLAPLAVFVLVCATCKSDIQLFFAGIITAIYGLVMMAVLVGVMLQIQQDGFLAPSSLFFFVMASEFVITAILHPKEFYCLKYGIVYYVTVPSMYMLLVIYSVFNMNDVSWGTRDVTVVPTPETEKVEGAEKKDEEATNEKKASNFSFLGADLSDNAGALQFSLNKLFSCMFCTYREDNKENEQLEAINKSILQLHQKLDELEKSNKEVVHPLSPALKTPETPTKPKGVSFDLPASEEDNESPSEQVPKNSWFYAENLEKSDIQFLDESEEEFWKELLETYLYPYEDDQVKVAADLKNLRDKMVFTFFMLNSLYVLVIFLLTLKKDFIHLNWPFEPKINFTYITDTNEVELYKDFLQLEPIGFVFLIFFALLLFMQFFGMLVHRFGTYQQILSNTPLDFNWFKGDGTSSVDEQEHKDDLKYNSPLKRAHDLIKQQMADEHMEQNEPISARKTVFQALEPNRNRKKKQMLDFETEAERIIEQGPSENMSDFTKKSVTFAQRRKTILQRASSVQRPSGLRHSDSARKSISAQLQPITSEYTTIDNPTLENYEQHSTI